MSRKKKRKAKRPRIPPAGLRALWDKVPEMKDCKGMCSVACGVIPVSKVERELMAERSGKPLGFSFDLTCNMLRENGTCSVYSVRPLICRIWGATKKLPCPEGCEPERWLSDGEVLELFAELEALVGDEDSGEAVEYMLAQMTPEQARAWQESKKRWHERWAGNRVESPPDQSPLSP